MNIRNRTGAKGRRSVSALKWEYLGLQELWASPVPGAGYCYSPYLWRTPVPGGWLIMTLNSRSNAPQPMTTFYPDPAHAWSMNEDTQQAYLLRPSAGAIESAPNELLRPGDQEEPE